MLGAFTTFSLDLVVLYERRALWPAVVYVVASVGLSIAALFAGLLLMRLLSPVL